MSSPLSTEDGDVRSISWNRLNTLILVIANHFALFPQIFERLQQRADPKVLEEQQQAVNERIHAIYRKAQNRLGELVWLHFPLILFPYSYPFPLLNYCIEAKDKLI